MKKMILLPFILAFLAACDEQVTEEYLIEGEWVATAGYIGGEVKGEPQCPVIEGMDFIDENNVYVDYVNHEFEYVINEESNVIDFFAPNNYMAFEIKIINENGMAISGLTTLDDQICYLERKTDG